MSIKKGILYQIGYTKRSWVEEISRVYEKNIMVFSQKISMKVKLKMENLTEMVF